MVFFQLAGMNDHNGETFLDISNQKIIPERNVKIFTPELDSNLPSSSCSKIPARPDVCTRLVSFFCRENKASNQEDPKPVTINFVVLVSNLVFTAEEMIYREISGVFCIEFIY